VKAARTVTADPVLRQLKALGLSDRRAVRLLRDAEKVNRLRTPAARFEALQRLVRRARRAL
jgi:hypothetical protein